MAKQMRRESTELVDDLGSVAIDLSMAIARLRARLREEAGANASGLTVTQLRILQRVLDEGPTSLTELAAAEHVSRQAVAQNLQLLRDDGYVSTERDSADARRILITETAAGRAFFESLLATRKVWLVETLASLMTPPEMDCLRTAIQLMDRLASCEPQESVEWVVGH